jgi:cobalamin biosynthesis protein CobT
VAPANPVDSADSADSVEDYACHELYQESEEAFASPEASRPEIPMAPTKSSVRRCLSDRFTALLQKRTFSEVLESESEDEESQEDCCTVLRSGMKYPRNLY